MTDIDATPARIKVQPHGPYLVSGAPVLRRNIVHSEHGEPMTWATTETFETR